MFGSEYGLISDFPRRAHFQFPWIGEHTHFFYFYFFLFITIFVVVTKDT